MDDRKIYGAWMCRFGFCAGMIFGAWTYSETGWSGVAFATGLCFVVAVIAVTIHMFNELR